MTSAPPPTGRRQRLGSELRKLREQAGLTATEAATCIGGNQARISNIEAGRYGVSADRVRVLASHYDCADEGLVEALAAMTGERKRRWWEEYRELLPASWLDLAELEHHAHRLRGASTAHIPGLLQTPEHAREIFRQAVPSLSPPDIEHRVSFRVKRQQVIHRAGPTPYLAIVHEAALRMAVGGPDIARAQLAHLLAVSEYPHVTVRAIPFSAGAVPGSGQSVYFAHGPVPQLDTVHLDQSHGLVFLNVDTQLDEYRELFARLEATALPPEESRSLIDAVRRNL
ncbi:helix-turn-helix transcriptional regulator [Streptomyces sp. NPDC089799]|uniref:helix-turn-helix domain-containing protein n=1 Tax=Streptomyces sp. NPDC089799 TaxID=3155066 RepID=UPI00341D086D